MARALTPSAGPLCLLLLASACSASSSPRSPSAPDAQPDGPLLSGTSCGLAEPVYLDADGDGHGTPDVHVLCEHGFVPSGWSKSFDDCDDGDPAKFRLYNRDADDDGVGARDRICAGAEAPPGYLLETGIPDCDDGNPAISRPYHVDADGDGMPPPNPREVCGPKGQAPPNTVSIYVESDPGDCDDNDPTVRVLYYQDLDGDGYAPTAAASICGSPDLGPPPGFAALGQADCDDSRADVHPNAFELWSDNIDTDCDGRPAPWDYTCVDAGPCGASWPGVPVDSTCGLADLVITEVEAEPICWGVWWGKIWIANQGSQPIADYVLEVDSPLGRVAFPIKDPLPPGSQYPYRLPLYLFPDGQSPVDMLDLEGEVRFTARGPTVDCNPANDTASKFAQGDACVLPP